MASRPSTPSAELPKSDAQERFKYSGIPAESVEEYRPGGFHPVDIGDTLRNGRYKIIRKLGDGSFSTVWLAVDDVQQQLVAVKVGVAKSSELSKELHIHKLLKSTAHTGIMNLLDEFEQRGPNGSHKCLVFPVMGPSVSFMHENLPRNVRVKHFTKRCGPRYCPPLKLAKQLMRDMLVGVSTLHSAGIVHGDLQCGNLLVAIRQLGIDDIGDLEQRIGSGHGGRSVRVRRLDGKEDPWSPERIYVAMPLKKFVDFGSEVGAKISDLGGAFPVDDPPAKIVTPVGLRAPEVIFKTKVDTKMDIWSFGCLLCEILTQVSLFSSLGGPGESDDSLDDQHLLQMVDMIGRLPDNLRAKWSRADRYLDPAGNIVNFVTGDDELGDDLDDETEPLSDHDDREHAHSDVSDAEDDAEDDDEIDEGDGVEVEPPSPPLGFDPVTGEAYQPGPRQDDHEPPLEDNFRAERLPEIDDAEAEQILALLRKMLSYDPKDRPTAHELLEDPWFKT